VIAPGCDRGLAIAFQRLRRKGAGTAGTQQCVLQQTPVAGADSRFRKPGDLKEKNIEALQELAQTGSQTLPEDGRVRHIQDDQPIQALRIGTCDTPADSTAPIVPDNRGTIAPGRIDQSDNIRRKEIDPIGADPCRLVARIIAPLVRSPDTVSQSGQKLDLVAPAIPELRKAVQQNHKRPLRRTSLYNMQVHTVRRNLR